MDKNRFQRRFKSGQEGIIPAPTMASPDKITVRPTNLDDDDIVQARRENATIPATYDDTSLGRRFLRWRLARQLYGRGPARKDRVGYIYIGPPASGKSTFGEAKANEIGAMVIDCDRAKELLPGYDEGRHAFVVHEESDEIMDAVYERTIENGGNFVRLLVGCNWEKIMTMLIDLQAMDYEMHLRFVPLEPELAAKRAVKRFRETGRFVDPSYVLFTVGNKPATTYDRLKDAGGWETCEIIEQTQ